MTRKLLFTSLVFCLASLSASHASTPWTASVLGGDSVVQARVGVHPAAGRTEVGFIALWDSKDDLNMFGAGVYATYDVIKDAEAQLLGIQVPTSWYVGGQIEVIDQRDPRPAVQLMTGFTFGDGKIQLGPEYQRALSSSLWGDLVDTETDRLFLNIKYTF